MEKRQNLNKVPGLEPSTQTAQSRTTSYANLVLHSFIGSGTSGMEMRWRELNPQFRHFTVLPYHLATAHLEPALLEATPPYGNFD